MGQNPVPPVNIPIPTRIGSTMGGAPIPKMVPSVLTHRHTRVAPVDGAGGVVSPGLLPLKELVVVLHAKPRRRHRTGSTSSKV